MPIARYYKGRGSKVMANMVEQYGAKKGKSVFYATAKKRGMTSRMPKGASLSPTGDIGAKRRAEARAQGWGG